MAERNQGGDMVETTRRAIDEKLPITLVHASRGKQTRAEPVAALFEQGKVHFVGSLPELEDELCVFDGQGGSPDDRVDALVWCLTTLMLQHRPQLSGKIDLSLAHVPGPANLTVGLRLAHEAMRS